MAKLRIFYKINKLKFEEALKKEGISQVAISKKSGVSESFLSAIKTGRAGCLEKTAKKILGSFSTKYEALDIFEVSHSISTVRQDNPTL